MVISVLKFEPRKTKKTLIKFFCKNNIKLPRLRGPPIEKYSSLRFLL
jgi:hypothetical protein